MVETQDAPSTFESLDGALLATLEVTINLTDEAEARKQAELLFAEIGGFFSASYLGLSMLYSLDFQIIEVKPGSWKFTAPVKLTLKKSWVFVKKTAIPIYLAVHTALGVPEDIGKVREYFKAVATQVTEHKQQAQPGIIKDVKCISPSDGGQGGT